MKKKRYLSRTAIFIICAAFAVIFLMPTVLTISNSFMTQSELNANYGVIFAAGEQGGTSYISEKVNLKFIPDKVSFDQYKTVLFMSPDYLLKFWNSVILVVPIVVFQVAIASVAAYSFTRWRGKARAFIFFFYVILMLMPYQVTLVPNYLVSEWLHLLDTRWAIILPGVFAPFSVFLLTKFMRRIPYSLIEAAKIDGAGYWRIFWTFIIPLAMPAIAAQFILSFIGCWNNYLGPLLFVSSRDWYPLALVVAAMDTSYGADVNNAPAVMAMAVLALIPVLVLFAAFQKTIIGSIMLTGSKE